MSIAKFILTYVPGALTIYELSIYLIGVRRFYRALRGVHFTPTRIADIFSAMKDDERLSIISHVFYRWHRDIGCTDHGILYDIAILSYPEFRDRVKNEYQLWLDHGRQDEYLIGVASLVAILEEKRRGFHRMHDKEAVRDACICSDICQNYIRTLPEVKPLLSVVRKYQ